MTRRSCFTFRFWLGTLLALFLLLPIARAADPPPMISVPRLLALLGSDDYEEREAAGRQLVQLGDAALPALDEAAQSTDAEVRRLARELARRIRTTSRAREVKK